MKFLQKVRRPLAISHSRKKYTWINKFIGKPPKTSNLGYFYPSLPVGPVFKTQTLSFFVLYDSLTSCRELEEIDEH